MIPAATCSSLSRALRLALMLSLASNIALADQTLKTATTNATNAQVLAGQILSRWAPIAQESGLDISVWQEQFSTQLAMMSANSLRPLDGVQINASVDAKANYARFADAFRSALMTNYVDSPRRKGNAKLGSSTTDQIFIPIVPCRVVDTRNVGGPVVVGFPRNFNFYAATSTYNWANQGGLSGNASTTCPGTVNPNGGAPSAAMATVTVVGPTAAGNFVGWGGAAPIPTTSILNWNNPGDIAANTTVLPGGGRSGTGPGGAIQDFAIAYNGPTGQGQVIVDVVGYFVENKSTALDCVTVTQPGVGTIANGAFQQLFPPACTAGYTLSGFNCGSNIALPNNLNFEQDSTQFGCVYHNFTGATFDATLLFSASRCCRVPGLP